MSDEIYGNLLGALVGSLLSGILAIYIFRHGNKTQIKLENEKEFSYLLNLKYLYFLLLSNIKNDISLFNIKLNDYKLKIIENPYTIHSIEIPTHQSLKRFLKIDNEKIITCFIYFKLNFDEYVNITKTVDYIDIVTPQIIIDLDIYRNEFAKNYSLNYIQKRDNLLSSCSLLCKNMNTDNKLLLKYVNDWLVKYCKECNSIYLDIKNELENYILPFQKEIVSNYNNEEFSYIVLNQIKEITKITIQLKNYSNEFVNTITLINVKFGENILALQNILDRVN